MNSKGTIDEITHNVLLDGAEGCNTVFLYSFTASRAAGNREGSSSAFEDEVIGETQFRVRLIAHSGRPHVQR